MRTADWFLIRLSSVGPEDPVLPVRQAIFSFEDGTDGFTTRQPRDRWHRGAVARVPHRRDARPAGRDPGAGQLVRRPGARVAGPARRSGRAWTNPHSSRTVTESFDDIECPSGVNLDVSRIRVVWVFLNTGGVVHIAHVRAE
ncbi:hypothetical protein [Actinoplanes auranticolor]|uniref:Uncharacterized protein n=1 Tax=Actinoplanes auranticolor TaxID=47988 RepID=A0A919S3Y1_9ACTN|nr:hypothetical protein [Actinoplanes auranticolor]GIM63826.1 hypothetical protein Aau02nite_06590 [Actinoplanes auranticolor]